MTLYYCEDSEDPRYSHWRINEYEMRNKCRDSPGEDSGSYAYLVGDNVLETLKDIEEQFNQDGNCYYQLEYNPYLIGLCEVYSTNTTATTPSPTTTKRELKYNLYYLTYIIYKLIFLNSHTFI